MIIPCPKCKANIPVSDFSPGESKRMMSCPSCGQAIQLNNQKMPQGSVFDGGEGATELGGKSNPGSTQLGGAASKKQSCYISIGRKRYDLQVGRNTIGRKASSSDAVVQIETGDLYMSRNHAIINVRRVSEDSIKVDLCNGRNKNATLVNGEMVGRSDSIFLHDGDTIVMGRTTMIFHFM